MHVTPLAGRLEANAGVESPITSACTPMNMDGVCKVAVLLAACWSLVQIRTFAEHPRYSGLDFDGPTLVTGLQVYLPWTYLLCLYC